MSDDERGLLPCPMPKGSLSNDSREFDMASNQEGLPAHACTQWDVDSMGSECWAFGCSVPFRCHGDIWPRYFYTVLCSPIMCDFRHVALSRAIFLYQWLKCTLSCESSGCLANQWKVSEYCAIWRRVCFYLLKHRSFFFRVVSFGAMLISVPCVRSAVSGRFDVAR